jgi:hypothetical protein
MAIGRRIMMLVALGGLAWSQTGLTTIQDTLFKADGTRFGGTLTIRWSTFDTANGNTIVQQSKSVQVVNGNLQVQLAPNVLAAPPANVYTVQYQGDGHEQFGETWSVPVSTTPLKVSSVRTGNLTSSGTGTTGNATPILESSVVGLVADLAQRPTKGVGYGTNRVAVVNDAGAIETVVGGPGDCVFVDGTAGPCAQPVFADAETPAGIVDGMNNTLTLASVPLGNSLMLFRNGLFQTPGLDYTMSGSFVQFATGAVPQPGDTLTAAYRVDTSDPGNIGGITTPVAALHTTSAQVICSATGSGTSAVSFVRLGSCPIPPLGLQAGDRIEVRFTFAHTGSSSGFDLQVNWGNTTILARHGTTQDAAVAGRAEAALTSTGAQLTMESWGTVLPFLPAILNAPAAPDGLRVDLRAQLSQATTDTVTLTSFTVLRYPGN